MKKANSINLIGIVFILVFSFRVVPSFSQTGIQCVGCKLFNGNHTPNCIYNNNKVKTTSASADLSFENQIMGTIFQSLLNSFLSPQKSNDPKNAEEIRIEQERQRELDFQQLKLKKHNDSISQARHDKLKKEMKHLEGSGELSYKGLNDVKPKSIILFNCKITSFKGDVKILRSNGKLVNLSENELVDLAVGDMIATGFNSNIKLHYKFESGGEDIMLGQQSGMTIIENEEGFPEPKFIGGKSRIYSTNNIVTEKISETSEKVLTDTEIALNNLKKKFVKKNCFRTPSAVTSVRGTDFTINVDSIGTTEVVVMDGIVDLKGILKEQIITLTKGYKGKVTSTGEVIGPLNIKDSEIEKW